MRMPFIYYVPGKKDKNREVFCPNSAEYEEDTWIVMIASHTDYITKKVAWMNNPALGMYCFVPNMDLREGELQFFSSEEDAYNFVKDWWKNQE